MATHEFEAHFHWIDLRGESPTCSGLRVAETPFPPRPLGEVSELASSVRLHGVLAPILVRPRGDAYEVVAGWSRLRAARLAGLSQVPAIARDLEDAAAIRVYLSTKAVRKALTPEAQQQALRALKDLRSAPPGPVGRDRGAFVPSPLAAEGISRTAGDRVESRRVESRAPRLSPPRAEVGEIAARASATAAAATATRAARDATAELFCEVLATRRLDANRAEEIVDRLLEIAEARSPLDLAGLYDPPLESNVAAHSVAVGLLAASMARSLGWGRARSRRFVVAGLLHDVGMVFVDAELRSSGALDARARDSLPRHATVGYALIESAGAWPLEVARCARDHHERWDGSGYPRGCRGASVSYSARLLAYLDTYAALISPRPYRAALAPSTALRRIKDASEGGKLDPELLASVTGLLSRLAVLPASAAVDGDGRPLEKTVELTVSPVTMPERGARSAGVRS